MASMEPTFDGDGDPSVVSGGTDCDDNDSTVENLDVDGDGSSPHVIQIAMTMMQTQSETMMAMGFTFV